MITSHTVYVINKKTTTKSKRIYLFLCEYKKKSILKFSVSKFDF